MKYTGLIYKLIFVLTLAFAMTLDSVSREVLAFTSPPKVQAPISSGLFKAQSGDRGIFNFLFGNRRERRRNVRNRPRQRNVVKPRSTTRSKPAVKRRVTPQQPKVPVIAKNEDAQQIVVIGDFFAKGLSDALNKVYAKSKDIKVVNWSQQGSGLVREDVIKWPETLKKRLETEQVDAAIIMMGINDMRDVKVKNGENIEFKTLKWKQEYEKRLADFAQLLTDKGIPVYWVGMPIMATDQLSSNASFINNLIERQAYRSNSRYIDTWLRFSDAEGNYDAEGPDINGRIRKIRHSNGIFLNKTGNAKLAFFVEQELRNGFASGAISSYGRSLRRRVIGVEISLTEQDSQVTLDQLAGAENAPKIDIRSREMSVASQNLIATGISPQPKAGRADEFPWPGLDELDAAEKSNTPPL